jgi:thioredoxin reductase (NADPH)
MNDSMSRVEGVPNQPVLLIVDAVRSDREAMEEVLVQRFGIHYRILSADSAESGLEMLARLEQSGHEVALVAADMQLPGTNGIEFLAQARGLHRRASRALLVAMDERGTRIPLADLSALQQATALGRIDIWVMKGTSAPEEFIYPRVQEALTAWTRANRPQHEVVRIVGEAWSPRSHELRDALSRNTVPFGFYAADSNEGRRLIRDYGVDITRLPALILYKGLVVHDPSPTDIAEALGVQTRPTGETYDVAILGAGPAGLSAAVYAASEGLHTLVIEPRAIGGQAGTSSMIRNYLGFPGGVSGSDLTFRAWEQSLLFGAQFLFTQQATGLSIDGDERIVALSGGNVVRSRAVIIACGVSYRRLGIPALDRLVGAGVFYGATSDEAPAMTGQDVYVVGGANSAGQAALHLARFASRVTVLIRGKSLAQGMSSYLISQLEAAPNIDVRVRTRVIDGHGEDRLVALTLEDALSGQREEVPAAAVFVMIGAAPLTEWLGDQVQRDARGFILTGRDVPEDAWPLERAPLPFETSTPGVFAVGDVRFGSVMRVASSVGEGSVAVNSVGQYLNKATTVVKSGS